VEIKVNDVERAIQKFKEREAEKQAEENIVDEHQKVEENSQIEKVETTEETGKLKKVISFIKNTFKKTEVKIATFSVLFLLIGFIGGTQYGQHQAKYAVNDARTERYARDGNTGAHGHFGGASRGNTTDGADATSGATDSIGSYSDAQ
jgi:hypothetical protein